jgi:hydrophobic/amphiphilic exporter-1 (mainly G- bacteria), HAE1 family
MVGGASISVRGQGPGFSSGGGTVATSNMRIKVLGYSYAGVDAADIKARLERIARVRDVQISSGAFFGGDRAYVVTLEPDRAALAHFGVTAEDLARSVSREVRGQVGRQLIEIGGEEVPVTLKEIGARDRSLDELRDALVPNGAASPVRIGDLAEVGEREALGQVIREDQQYVRVVSYDFKGPAKLARRTHDAFLRSIALPAGYAVGDPGFGLGIDDESERGLWLVFGLGVALVVLAVAVVFDSAWAAWMVLLSLPMALAGVAAAFWMTKTSFTREAAVGVILVVGLAVNQAILLVDAALDRRRANRAAGVPKPLGPAQALTAAVDRSAMMVLVTLTTLASLIPLAVGEDSAGLFGAIALATTGGTIASTIGVMAVMPALLVGRRK